MVKQNRQDAERLLERIVREKGEDTTAECQYSTLENTSTWDEDTGQWYVDGPADLEAVAPICIVGCAVYEIGGVEALVKIPHDNTAYTVSTVSDLFDEGATAYLTAAQWVQDHGGTWGQAVQIANKFSDEQLVEAVNAKPHSVIHDLLYPEMKELGIFV